MEIIETETANGQYDLSAGIRCMSPKRRVRTRTELANIRVIRSVLRQLNLHHFSSNRLIWLGGGAGGVVTDPGCFLALKQTNTIIYVYLLSMETDIFGNSLSRNTTDARNNWNSHTNRLMTNIGLE